jgi:hypothetical protein
MKLKKHLASVKRHIIGAGLTYSEIGIQTLYTLSVALSVINENETIVLFH